MSGPVEKSQIPVPPHAQSMANGSLKDTAANRALHPPTLAPSLFASKNLRKRAHYADARSIIFHGDVKETRNSPIVTTAIEALSAVNDSLTPAQLQIGYRVRDEVAMFCLHAHPYVDAFTTTDASPVDPLDLAITMKVLPRIQGGGLAIEAVLINLLAWAKGGTTKGPSVAGAGTAYAMCADRVMLMLERLRQTGFTSYWL
jgi:hypothetical protein